MITFNNKLMQDFGVYVEDSAAHAKPIRSYERIEVPGRDGDLTISNNRFENVDITLTCLIKKEFIERYAAFLAFLQSTDGYQRLELGTEADFYRMAILKDIDEPELGPWAHFGKFDLTFSAKPQRWYKSGEMAKENPTSLINPSYYTALPLIRCYGAGTLKFGTETIVIAKNSYPYIDIDCELQDAYYGATNCNSLITLSSGDFPTLPEGKTGMSFTGTKFEVTPRWWTI